MRSEVAHGAPALQRTRDRSGRISDAAAGAGRWREGGVVGEDGGVIEHDRR
jgi:hypothetical protein